MAELDYYKILGVPKGATTSQIKARYQTLSKKYHPDRDGDDSIMSLINEAYKTLSDPKSKYNYDHGHKAHEEKKQEKHSNPIEELWDDILPSEDDIKKSSIIKKIYIAGAFILVIAVILGIVGYNNQKSKNDALSSYKSNLSTVSGLNNSLQSDYNQIASLPSTTTNTKSGWDSYYQNLISEVQGINSEAKTSYSNVALNSFNSDVETASTDLLSYLNLAQSASDMSFQVQDDQSSVNSDNGTIEEYQGDDATDGADIMQGEITSEQSTLSTDETTLKNDQQTYASQEAQLKSLDNTVLSDLSKLTTDSKSI